MDWDRIAIRVVLVGCYLVGASFVVSMVALAITSVRLALR